MVTPKFAAMSQRRPRSGRRRGRLNRNALTERDLVPHRIPGTELPPIHIQNPEVYRKLRFQFTYTGAGFSQVISPASLANQDNIEYLGSSGTRFSRVRLMKAEAWYAASSEPTSGAQPQLSLTDSTSDISYTDVPNGSVCYAHVAYKLPLQNRSVYFLANDSTSGLVTIAMTSAAGANGNMTVDCTAAFS